MNKQILTRLEPLEAQEALYKLTDHFLGPDWYIIDPVGVNQANAIIVDEILKKYSGPMFQIVKKIL